MAEPPSKPKRGSNPTELRARLERAGRSIDIGAPMPPEVRHRILDERARRLAAPPPCDEDSCGRLEVVEFSLASETYGVAIEFVGEVASMRDFSPLPGAPAFVAGIVNVRGRIVSVIDLHGLFGVPIVEPAETGMAIVLHSASMEFALWADSVAGVRSFEAGALRGLPPTLTGPRAAFSLGIVGGSLVVLDAERMLSDRTLIPNGNERTS